MVTRADSNWSVYHDPKPLKVGEYRDPRQVIVVKKLGHYITTSLHVEQSEYYFHVLTSVGIPVKTATDSGRFLPPDTVADSA